MHRRPDNLNPDLESNIKKAGSDVTEKKALVPMAAYRLGG